MFSPGTQVGDYRVVGPLGRPRPDGPFEVDDAAGRRFALRAPIADLPDDPSPRVSQRFEGDARALLGVVHLNLVPMFASFVHDGHVCLVSERVRGRSLTEPLSHGQLPPIEALMIGRQLLDGAAVAHDAGLVHRDLRPSKILLVQLDGWELVKIAGFGVATLCDEAVLEFGSGVLTGTARTGVATYQAPEQVRGRSVDARTDLYAIGTIVFEMLAGRAPFPDRDLENVRSQQLSLAPPKLSALFPGEGWVTPEVELLVDVALSKDREARFTSAAQMIATLESAARSIR